MNRVTLDTSADISEIAISTLLKNARKAKGLTVKAVSQDICVQSSYLKAIENGAYDKLPPQPFKIGFVRAYATALGLDADKIVAAFKKECGSAGPSVVEVPAFRKKTKQKKMPVWLTPIAGLVGVSLCWAALGGSINSAVLVADAYQDIAVEKAELARLQSTMMAIATGPIPTEASPMLAEGVVGATEQTTLETASAAEPRLAQPQTIQPQEAQSQGSQSQGSQLQASQSQASQSQASQSQSLFLPAAYADSQDHPPMVVRDIVVTASEDSWVRMARADGTEIWSGILRAGQTYSPQEAGVMLLTTSNAGALTVTQGTETEVSLGHRGEIVSDYALALEDQVANAGSASTVATGGTR